MKKTSIALLAVAGAALAAIAVAWPRAQHVPAASPAAYAATPGNIARGAYLAKAGDCIACHTARAMFPGVAA